MLEELEIDVSTGNLLQSGWLSTKGQLDWADLINDALARGSDDGLARQLQLDGRIRQNAERKTPKGGMTVYKVPYTANQTIAEGEFNRYYVRGVCRCVIEDGNEYIEIYRGKVVATPRTGSEEKIGKRFSASDVLHDLRNSVGLEPALGLPPGPNSGLTARIPV